MSTQYTDLVSLIKRSLGSEESHTTFEESGIVINVGDGICRVYGLNNVVFNELVTFENGNKGIVLDIDENFVSVVLFDQNLPVPEQATVRRTGKVFTIPVSEALLGRIVDAEGKPIDSLGAITGTVELPIENQAPGIVERSPVNEPLQTGFIAIDSLIPIGKGQRELLIGNRTTGKTAIALDIILNQKDKDVICIYVSIAHKQSNTAKIVDTLERHGALDYTIVVSADAQESALKQFFAPYTGCTIGEFFTRKGRDVLIIYDDLSNHAIAYRELSLLLRRPPGREAYPGDIFYIHSRLLERAGKFSPDFGGGSLTALPIIQTQGDDISGFIPTNLISITDGQIFLDTTLFNNGIRPAVNIGLSVSRVGGAAQHKATKKVAGSLKLELAQYQDLLAFAQFGSELDKGSQAIIERGKRAIELLKQGRMETLPFVDQVLFLFMFKEHYLDELVEEDVRAFTYHCTSYIKEMHSEICVKITESLDLSDLVIPKLHSAIQEFSLTFPKKSRVY